MIQEFQLKVWFFLIINQEIIYSIIDPGRTAETTGISFCFLDLLLILIERDLRFFAKSKDIYRNLTRFSSTKILLVNLIQLIRGFSQRPREDYTETFSPTIRGDTLRLLLALVAAEDLEVLQLDVVSAYPRSRFHARVYMKLIEPMMGTLGIKDPNKVLRLKNSMYGLERSGREWYIEACRDLKTLGFEPLYSGPSVFWSLMTG
jgi:hypothetical protein